MNDYPKVKINIQQGSSERIEKKLLDNSIDFAFTSFRERPQFEWIDLVQDELLVILPNTHPLVSHEYIPLKELQNLQFIGSSSDYEYDVNRILREKNITSSYVKLFTNDEGTIIEMVKKGLGTGLIFNSYLEEKEQDNLTVKKISPPLYRKLGVAVRPDESKLPIVKTFLDYTAQVMTDEYL